MPLPRHQLYRKLYPLRALGTASGFIAVVAVLYHHQAPTVLYALAVLNGLVWPHLAWLHARTSGNPFRAEKINLLLDCVYAGAWATAMQFCLLPSVVLVTATVTNQIATGIRGLWWRGALTALGATAATAWLAQPQPRLESPLPVVLLTLPLLVGYTLATSLTMSRLIRTVGRQNRELEMLRCTDEPSGLASRAHWLQQAQAALDAFHATGQGAFLLIIDTDRFKAVNDCFGHTVGDEVIRAVGGAIRQSVRAHDAAGRYGGDEFMVVCLGVSLEAAHGIAERIRSGVQALDWPHHPDLRTTASIGMAAAAPAHAQLRDWLNAADAALYRAKNAGRNRVEVSG
ncbi:MAG: diguanylate cyclase [Acidovorax sp.]